MNLGSNQQCSGEHHIPSLTATVFWLACRTICKLAIAVCQSLFFCKVSHEEIGGQYRICEASV